MSTILDALKKSEQQRQQSEDHQGPYRPSSSVGRPTSPMWFVGLAIVVLGGIGLAWLAWQRTDESAGIAANPAPNFPEVESRATEPSTEPPAEPNVAELDPAEPGTNEPMAVEPASETRPITDSPVEESVDEPDERRVVSTEWSVGDNASTERDAKLPNDSQPVAVDAPITVTEIPPEAGPKPVDEPPSRQPDQPSQPRSAPPADRAGPGTERAGEQLAIYPGINRRLRDSLGPLKLNMLMFSGDAERRFALINMQRVVVGDAVGSATVQDLRQEGVVLEADGQRFLLAPSN